MVEPWLSPGMRRKSCDQCVRRKTRCSLGQDPSKPCEPCRNTDQTCTFQGRSAPRPPAADGASRSRRLLPRLSVGSTIADKNQTATTSQKAGSKVPPIGRLPTTALVNSLQHQQYPPRGALGTVIDWPMLHRVVDVYFEYLYCLLPCVHRPTFLIRLRDKQSHPASDPDIFDTLVLLLLATTLVQVPWAFSTASRADIRTLALRCFAAGKVGAMEEFREPTLDRCVSLYLAGVVCHILEYKGSAEMFHSGACAGLMSLEAHKSEGYQGLDVVDAEMRRRLFWLVFGSDRARNAMLGSPTHLTGDQYCTVAYPTPTDDEFLELGVQPEGLASVMVGFRVVSHLFSLLGRILDWRRSDRHYKSSAHDLCNRIRQVDAIHQEILNATLDIPPQLRLPEQLDSPGIEFSPAGWDDRVHQAVQSLMAESIPGHGQRSPKYAFIVQQANIYLTQLVARCLTITYRGQLLAQREMHQHHIEDGGYDMRMQRVTIGEEVDGVADELITLLSRIPVKAFAINNVATISKIRYIASTQLDSLPPVESTVSTASAASMAAQRRLWSFIDTLIKVEAMADIKSDALPLLT